MLKDIKNIDKLTLTPKTFTNDKGETFEYFDCKVYLSSGLDIPIKISRDYASLLYNGHLK